MPYQAYFNGSNVVADTPRQAAAKFFEKHPKGRKCNIVSGKVDGPFFVVTYGRASEGNWPTTYKDVTKKTMVDLPDSVEPVAGVIGV